MYLLDKIDELKEKTIHLLKGIPFTSLLEEVAITLEAEYSRHKNMEKWVTEINKLETRKTQMFNHCLT